MRYMNGWLGVGGRGLRAGARAIFAKRQSQLTYLTYNSVREKNKMKFFWENKV